MNKSSFRPPVKFPTSLFMCELSVVHRCKCGWRVRHESRRKHREQQRNPSRFRICWRLLKFLELLHKGLMMYNPVEWKKSSEKFVDELCKNWSRWEKGNHFRHAWR